MTRHVKAAIVAGLEQACGILDNTPGVWKTDHGRRFVRRSQLGCTLGLANLSSRLDDRWGTGVWDKQLAQRAQTARRQMEDDDR